MDETIRSSWEEAVKLAWIPDCECASELGGPGVGGPGGVAAPAREAKEARGGAGAPGAYV